MSEQERTFKSNNMEEHFCKKEKEIDKLYKVVIDGNGTPPLVKVITEMSAKLDSYMARQEDLIKEYHVTNMEFHEFREKVKTTHSEKLRSEESGRHRTTIFVSIICVVLAAFLGWMVKTSSDVAVTKKNVYDLMPSSPRGGQKIEIPKK